MPRLTLTTEAGSTHSIELEHYAYTIGRAGDCEIHIDDLSLSGHHARLERRDDGWYLTDLESTNGSKINGIPLTESQLLRHDDALALGDVTGFFSNIADVSRTKEMPGQRAKHEAELQENSADHLGTSRPPADPVANLWRLVTLLVVANIILALALAAVLVALFSIGKETSETITLPTSAPASPSTTDSTSAPGPEEPVSTPFGN